VPATYSVAVEGTEARPGTEARQNLYDKIARITSENVHDVAAELRQLDLSGLPASDRELLGAVLAIAGAVTDPDPRISTAMPENSLADRLPADLAQGNDAMVDSGSVDTQKKADAEIMKIDGFITGAREMLQDIDKTLEEVR
jgi:hypothetical protein